MVVVFGTEPLLYLLNQIIVVMFFFRMKVSYLAEYILVLFSNSRKSELTLC